MSHKQLLFHSNAREKILRNLRSDRARAAENEDSHRLVLTWPCAG